MTLTVALQMDPLHALDVKNDSSLLLGLEAQRRGYKLYHYLPFNLSLKEGRVIASGHAIALYESGRHEPGKHFECGAEEELALADFDVILLRQDPPFDLAYLTTTWLLEKLHPETLVVNDPTWIRSMPEKIFVTEFPDLMPPTLITSDLRQVSAFRAEHRDIIVKPLYGNGGAGVFHLPPEDENLSALIELYQKLGREPFMVQRYLPEVRVGDKRIILIDGQPAGGVLRVPAPGEARANMHVGGQAVKMELTRRDLEICERIGPILRERGQVFVGIDVIGNFLTEINVTSPTGIQQINRLDTLRLEAKIWDAIERRL